VQIFLFILAIATGYFFWILISLQLDSTRRRATRRNLSNCEPYQWQVTPGGQKQERPSMHLSSRH
jgi:hypothetical protein